MRKLYALLSAAVGVSIATAPFAALAAPSGGAAPVSVGVRPAWTAAATDLGRAPDARVGHLTVLLARTPERQAAFDALRVAQQTPGSPDYHRWLTPAQIGERYGASETDLAALTAWLRGRGLRVDRVAAARTFVEVNGDAPTAEAAFGVELHRYRAGGKLRVAADRAPRVPARFAGLVRGVTGLAEVEVHPTRPPAPPYDAGDLRRAMSPEDVATIFDIGSVYASDIDGTGQTIGIVSLARAADADVLQRTILTGWPTPNFETIVPPLGVDPGPACGDPSCFDPSDADDEATLDVENSTSTAPGAHVELIASRGNGMEDGLTVGFEYLIDSYGAGADANILSLSYGGCETAYGDTALTLADTLFQQGAAQGQTILISSGDDGAYGCSYFTPPSPGDAPGINFFCASAAVTCVGGTQPVDPDPSVYWDANTDAISYIPEGAWSEADATSQGSAYTLASGGGESLFIARPTYQDAIAPAGTHGRLVPDIAMPASFHDGYLGCFSAEGASCVPGSGIGSGSASTLNWAGTSASTPAWAGVVALVGQAAGGGTQGAINPALYRLGGTTPGAFHDVTIASSSVLHCNAAFATPCDNSGVATDGSTAQGFTVGSGWDEVTGWGSPDVAQLIAAWPGVQPALFATPSRVTLTPGAHVLVALTAAGFGSGAQVAYSCGTVPSSLTCAVDGDQVTVTAVATSGSGTGAGSAGFTWVGGGGLALLIFLQAARRRGGVRGRRVRRVRAIVLGVAFAAASCGGSSDTTVDAPSAPVVDAPIPQPTLIGVDITATAGTVSAKTTLQITLPPQ